MNRLFRTILNSLPIVILLTFTGAGMKKNDIRSGELVPLLNDTSSYTNQLKVDPFRLLIIPPSEGVQFYKDGIVFLSLSKNEGKMSSAQISFGTVEAYWAPLIDTVLGRHLVFSPLSSFSYPCEAITFANGYKTIYYTKIARKGNKQKIFKAEFILNNKRQLSLVEDTKPLDFCSDNYNYSHPALSSDGNMIVFASDREGSFGGMDLFVARKTGDTWSAPEDLGKSINTSGNEFFPFLDRQNNLYFSSDNLPGLGGYDIFTCRFNGRNWDKPLNLSYPVNSVNDDIAFTINKSNGDTAFFSRKDRSGKGTTSLFMVTLKQERVSHNLLSISDVFQEGNVTADKTKNPGPSGELNPVETMSAKINTDTATTKINKPLITKREAEPVTTKTESVIIFRVQIFTYAHKSNPEGISVAGTIYNFFEYYYRGAYRYTIGEFSSLKSATELQNRCRQSGYPQAFVVAFKNGSRSLDPNLFK